MGINFNFAKKFTAEQIIKRAMNYIEKDPKKNFIKILNLVDKIARTENRHQEIAAIKENYKTSPVIQHYVKKFTEIAPSYKEGLVMNFFINSGLLGIPKQAEVAEELGIYFIVLSGGEPTVYPELFEIFKRHQDVGFMMFTISQNIHDERMAHLKGVDGNDKEKYMTSPFNDTFTKRYFEQMQD